MTRGVGLDFRELDLLADRDPDRVAAARVLPLCLEADVGEGVGGEPRPGREFEPLDGPDQPQDAALEDVVRVSRAPLDDRTDGRPDQSQVGQDRGLPRLRITVLDPLEQGSTVVLG